MPPSPFTLESLRSSVVKQFPSLSSATFTLLAEGWDSVALDADEQWIFKFPRHAQGEAALRREVGLLAIVAPVVDMPVPQLTLIEAPRIFSRHRKIAGAHLLGPHYAALPEAGRDALAAALGVFYAQLHTIAPATAANAGALPAETWLDAAAIEQHTWPLLPDPIKPFARRVLQQWAALGPDPLGDIYGFFDGHGWNMAFDHAAQRLNGVYDFADSGIGPLHREFIYSSLVSPDLTARIIDHYERNTNRHIDRERVEVLTGTHRLWELAMEAELPDHVPTLVEAIGTWADWLSTAPRGGRTWP